jgi:hypothetical protein
MLYTPVTKNAIRFCYNAHAGQLDKAGLPYVNHPLHLAEQMSTEDETCVALLHDVMEDCGATPEDLLALGISPEALAAVQLLTHKDGVSYLDYVRAVGENPIARRVKVADLRHNSDLTRLDEVGPKDIARLRKYRKARVILGDMATKVQTPAGPVAMQVAGEPYPFVVRDESGRRARAGGGRAAALGWREGRASVRLWPCGRAGGQRARDLARVPGGRRHRRCDAYRRARPRPRRPRTA